MATCPYFVVSPSTILSLIGVLRGPDRTRPTPAEDWREANVDVIIPALNEADNIVPCLASLLRQTLKPRRIMLIDDGSTDATVARAKAFCGMHGVELTAIRRQKPIGKTPTIKRQARELDSDVEFILDADTVLESDNYIERTVQELYQAVGIASAFGTILPQRQRDRQRYADLASVRAFDAKHPSASTSAPCGWFKRLRRGVTNLYRETLYLFLQRFVYRGQLAFFGTTSNPVGCAVAYRRKYVKALFDHISPILGDDLTNSEDIFIGFAMLNEGYRNIQLTDVRADGRTEAQRLRARFTCGRLVPAVLLLLRPSRAARSSRCDGECAGSRRWPDTRRASRRPPTRWPVRRCWRSPARTWVFASDRVSRCTGPRLSPIVNRAHKADSRSGAGGRALDASGADNDRRTVREPYRQAFGRERTAANGRPAGWILLISAFEKILFPFALLTMILLGRWEALGVTMVAETAVCMTALALVMKGKRMEYALKAAAVTPIRYALIGTELITIGRFTTDLWITRNRSWRK